jgi:hypothetical protein
MEYVFFWRCARLALAAGASSQRKGVIWVFNFILLLLSFDCPKESNKEKATAYEKFGVITTEVCPRASQAGRKATCWHV